MSKKSIQKIGITGGILSLLLALGSVYVYTKFANSSSPQAYIQNSTDFTIYTPANTQKGTILPDSIANSGKVLSYSIILSDDTSATITEQVVPVDFSPATYFYTQSVDAAEFDYGKYYDVSNVDQPRYMIITNDDVLLFATGEESTEKQVLIDAINSLKPQD